MLVVKRFAVNCGEISRNKQNSPQTTPAFLPRSPSDALASRYLPCTARSPLPFFMYGRSKTPFALPEKGTKPRRSKPASFHSQPERRAKEHPCSAPLRCDKPCTRR